MTTTLVGMFDKLDEAQEARRKLLQEGLSDSMVKLTSTNSAATHPLPMEAGEHRGFFARLFGLDEPDEYSGHYAEAVRRGSSVVTVQLADGRSADRVRRILEDCGAIDVDQRVEQWKAGGYTGFDAAASPYGAAEAANDRHTLKVMEEELKVGKRALRTGGVHVRQYVSEKPVSADVTLRRETAVIQRRAVDRPATEAELDAFGKADRDIEIRETTEEPVVSKTARVVEEVDVGKQASERTETVEDKVRRTDVEVRQMAGERRHPSQNRPSSPPR
jgi:uncharacterized protein (TIGR02271 family)